MRSGDLYVYRITLILQWRRDTHVGTTVHVSRECIEKRGVYNALTLFSNVFRPKTFCITNINWQMTAVYIPNMSSCKVQGQFRQPPNLFFIAQYLFYNRVSPCRYNTHTRGISYHGNDMLLDCFQGLEIKKKTAIEKETSEKSCTQEFLHYPACSACHCGRFQRS